MSIWNKQNLSPFNGRAKGELPYLLRGNPRDGISPGSHRLTLPETGTDPSSMRFINRELPVSLLLKATLDEAGYEGAMSAMESDIINDSKLPAKQ